MILQSQREWEGMAAAGAAAARVMERVCAAIKPGMTTRHVDRLVREGLRAEGAKSAPREAYRFPGDCCLSVNRQAAHGIPGWYRLRPGDTLNVDISLELNGFYADTGRMVQLGPVPEVYRSLCAAAEQGLRAGIAACKPGVPMREIGAAMERRVRAAGFVPIRNLTGHGIGRELHEAPRHLYCYDHAAEERCAQLGMTLALECFAATFTSLAEPGDDGWAMLVKDLDRAAQAEHTVAVGPDGAVILTEEGEKHGIWMADPAPSQPTL